MQQVESGATKDVECLQKHLIQTSGKKWEYGDLASLKGNV